MEYSRISNLLFCDSVFDIEATGIYFNLKGYYQFIDFNIPEDELNCQPMNFYLINLN